MYPFRVWPGGYYVRVSMKGTTMVHDNKQRDTRHGEIDATEVWESGAGKLSVFFFLCTLPVYGVKSLNFQAEHFLTSDE